MVFEILEDVLVEVDLDLILFKQWLSQSIASILAKDSQILCLWLLRHIFQS